jgi:hypothetical protein
MKSPYTNVAANQKAHAAGTVVILSTNAPGFYDEFLNKNNDETVTGLYDFSTSYPTLPGSSPTTSTQAASKGYVDGVALAGVPNATTTVQGALELATAAELTAGTATGATGASLAGTPATLAAQIQSGSWTFAATAGTAPAATLTLVPAATALTHGMVFGAHITTGLNAGATLNLNGLGAKALYKYAGGAAIAIEAGDCPANYHHLFQYDSDADVILVVNPANGTLTAAMQDEVEGFFGSTDITGAEAEDLTDGGSTTLHTHPVRLSYFVIPDQAGNYGSLTAETGVQGAFSPDGADFYLGVHYTGSNKHYLSRYTRDSVTGLYLFVGQANNSGNVYADDQQIGIVVGDTYVWTLGANLAGTNTAITRWTRALGSETSMTVSGTATVDGSRACGNDSILYFFQESTGTTCYVYTVSGTTATRSSTFTTPNQGQNMRAPYFDGTDILYYDTSTNSYKRMDTSGSVQATLTYGPWGSLQSYPGAVQTFGQTMPVASGYMMSGAVYIVDILSHDNDDASGGASNVHHMQFFGVTKI